MNIQAYIYSRSWGTEKQLEAAAVRGDNGTNVGGEITRLNPPAGDLPTPVCNHLCPFLWPLSTYLAYVSQNYVTIAAAANGKRFSNLRFQNCGICISFLATCCCSFNKDISRA